MDGTQFDGMTRKMGESKTRRGAIAALIGGIGVALGVKKAAAACYSCTCTFKNNAQGQPVTCYVRGRLQGGLCWRKSCGCFREATPTTCNYARCSC